jgi:hypothetical protein
MAIFEAKAPASSTIVRKDQELKQCYVMSNGSSEYYDKINHNLY